ncbi:hypothetical protein Glove_217g103 [Diversispora epigaea]|uniref:Uncharacterized protein n=1 Tax=Diversispora epigaea TaxID=1348612 RepID=A0A397IJR1_9GLOM|nr:hypothetical protein Glove_217g103 [Diversispora epigaea]
MGNKKCRIKYVHTLRSLDVTFLSGHRARTSANSNCSRAPAQINMTSNIIASTIQFEFDSWKPSNKLKKLYNHFNNTVLNQFSCVPCSYCSRLLYPSDTKTYPLTEVFPNVPLCFHPKLADEKIASCKPFLNPLTCQTLPKLDCISNEIALVPMYHRIYLSPIHLSCSLALYTDTIGALLENNTIQSWYHPTLLAAVSWLHQNNNFFKIYDHFYDHGSINGPPLIFPTARILSTSENNIRSITQANLQPADIIIPNTNFNHFKMHLL